MHNSSLELKKSNDLKEAADYRSAPSTRCLVDT